jgi:hypothetical protein
VSVWPSTADPDIVGAGVESKIDAPTNKSDVGSPDMPEIMAPEFLDFSMDSKLELPEKPSERSLATAPATWGAAMDVPLFKVEEESLEIPADIMFFPGA